MERISREEFEARYGAGSASQFKQPNSRPSTFQTAKDLGIGAVKGLGDTAFAAGNFINEGIKRSSSNSPVMSILQVGQKELTERGLNPFEGDNQTQIQETLKADNTTQKWGKGAQFALELLFPATLATRAPKVAGAVFENIGSRLSGLPDDVIEGGVKVKDRIIEAVTNLDDRTKTALTRTPLEKFQEVFEQGKQAMLDDRNRTPLQAVGGNIISGLEQIKTRAGSIGEAKSQLMEQAKIGYQRVGNIAQRTALGIQKSFSDLKLDAADSKIVEEFKQTLMNLGDNPSLREVDATIDLLQDRLYKTARSNAVEVTDRITGKLRSAIGELNSQVKELGGEAYGKLNQEYSDLITTVNELNARLGKEGASAGSFVKRLFSPSDARTKELFEQLERYTGQDFFRDARLAKFVMDVLGDNRAKSLLDELPTNTAGLIASGFNYVKKKISDPIRAAEQFIKRQGKGDKLPAQTGKQNMAAAPAGIETDENGDASFDPVTSMLALAGMKGLGKKEALQDLIGQKTDNLYLIKQRGTQLGEKVSKRLVATLEKELKALRDEFRKL